jgi:Ser/Thr protein kinase RdoA (MazF antagonist)
VGVRALRLILSSNPARRDYRHVRGWHEQILRHLEVTAPEVPLPRLLPTTSGEFYAVEHTHRDDLFVRLLTWLPGTALADQNGHSDELLTEIGRTAGRLTEALSSMPEPKPEPTHHWDMLRARSVIEHESARSPTRPTGPTSKQ